jgi:uncharacterized membrane protein
MTASERKGLRQAAVLGGVSGARTFIGLAGLAVRGRLGKAAKFVVPVLAAGEMVGDKLAAAPGRSEAPGVAGRVVAGAISGRVAGGWRGARIGAAFALATTYPSERLRAITCQRTGLIDQAFAVGEDVTVAGIAVLAAAEPEREPLLSDPAEAAAEIGPVPIADAEPAPERPSPLGAAVRGLAAAAVGTAAMTTAQNALEKLVGQEPSEVPGEVGRRIIEGVFGRQVPGDKRGALNQGMHAVYGTQWGLPFGLAVGSLRRAPRASDGVVLGLAVWAIGLAELPALGLAPAPWKQSPADLATDLGFHLVYGAATGAAYEAFAGQ